VSRTAIYAPEACLRHEPGPGHPESPERFKSVTEALAREFPRGGKAAAWRNSPPGTDAQVLYCHAPEYLASLKKAVAGLAQGPATVNTDVDTRVSAGSLEAAMAGVGAVCQAVDDVCAGTADRALCIVRPPGHHALKKSSMGFCLFGNVAIAAFHALKKHGLKRAAIIDYDVHHGNGTQELVEHTKEILFFSTHESPLWPYQKDAEASVRGAAGNIRNFPVPTKAAPQVHRDIFTKQIIPELREFKPEIVILSAGFDAHRDDPPPTNLFNDPPGRQMLTEPDFAWMTEQLIGVADTCAKGRFVAVLEGGYNVKVLASCCVTLAKTLAAGAQRKSEVA
jgi:acetoin utilization deacetylase AcuC-like enzyme